MKEKLTKIFGILLLLVFIVYMVGSGIYDLTNKKDLYTVKVNQAAEILEIEHSINGLIPVGKDHYYFAADGATGDAYIICASKSWYNKNFDATGMTKTADGISVTALAKKCDFDVARELEARAAQIEGVNFVVSPAMSLVQGYKFFALCKILVVVLGLLLGLFVYLISKGDKEVSGTTKKIILALFVAWLVVTLMVLVKIN